MYIFNCLMLAFHKSQNMQQAINWYKCSCYGLPCTAFDVHILQQDVMCEDIFLRMLDVPYSLPFLI
jgi:hypothetical protein